MKIRSFPRGPRGEKWTKNRTKEQRKRSDKETLYGRHKTTGETVSNSLDRHFKNKGKRPKFGGTI